MSVLSLRHLEEAKEDNISAASAQVVSRGHSSELKCTESTYGVLSYSWCDKPVGRAIVCHSGCIIRLTFYRGQSIQDLMSECDQQKSISYACGCAFCAQAL
jgi:hypothetical protein